jgi:diguanylate cyclase
VRTDDFVARWGGEEFVVLLPETDLQEAEVVGEKLRQAVEARVISRGGAVLNVTVSVGCAQLSDGDASADALFQRCDEHLYAAKRTGRNCVRSSPHL